VEPFAQTHAVSEVEYPSHASGDTGLRAADQERLEPAGPVARRGGCPGVRRWVRSTSSICAWSRCCCRRWPSACPWPSRRICRWCCRAA